MTALPKRKESKWHERRSDFAIVASHSKKHQNSCQLKMRTVMFLNDNDHDEGSHALLNKIYSSEKKA